MIQNIKDCANFVYAVTVIYTISPFVFVGVLTREIVKEKLKFI